MPPFERFFNRKRYEFFDRKEETQLFKIIGRFSEYIAEQENIANVVFLDRSARAAWAGVHEYLRTKYPDLKRPNMHFMNPAGFQHSETADSRNVYHMQMMGMVKQLETIANKSPEDIEQELNEKYPALMLDKNKPLILFDTCSHTGNSVNLIKNTLEKAGFIDVRVITANTPEPESGVEPAFILDREMEDQLTCQPFGYSDSEWLPPEYVESINYTPDSTKRRKQRVIGIGPFYLVRDLGETEGISKNGKKLRKEIRTIIRKGLEEENSN